MYKQNALRKAAMQVKEMCKVILVRVLTANLTSSAPFFLNSAQLADVTKQDALEKRLFKQIIDGNIGWIQEFIITK